MRIVLGNASVAFYPDGGGHWSWFLQYPLGLRGLGHDVYWLELLESSGDRSRDLMLIDKFFARVRGYGLADRTALLLMNDLDFQELDESHFFGGTREQVSRWISGADLLWNLSCSIREPLLSRFRHRVLIDTDPGHLQVAAFSWDLGIDRHDAFLTVGTKIHDADCGTPTLGHRWRSFLPFVYLPFWPAERGSNPDAPITSITQWTWEELSYQGRTLSASKRAGYLRYADLPLRCGRPFELAANIGDVDPAGDRDRLRAGGWHLAEPHEVASTPEKYRTYLANSRAEILCPKPIYRELRTGWFSDRSASYLASGRPVIAEDTGVAIVPAGRGLFFFTNMDQAIEAVRDVDANYAHHSAAARELALEFFDSAKCLKAMLSASF